MPYSEKQIAEWVRVPLEPTPKMIVAGANRMADEGARGYAGDAIDCYRAMLAAVRKETREEWEEQIVSENQGIGTPKTELERAKLHGPDARTIDALRASIERAEAAERDFIQVHKNCLAAREDAERYKWLREHSTRPVEPWSTHDSPESLDEAIDAAMSQQEKKDD